jgi:SRSO17 transposase
MSVSVATPIAQPIEGLADYLSQFRADFGRRDRFRWAEVYLQGLLLEGGRKNVETLASRVLPPPELARDNAIQALQHFLNQSPWDERRLLRRYRAQIASRYGTEGTFVLSEITFPKTGRRSVGVQRQFSRDFARKLNCQIAVALHHVTIETTLLVNMRLYLPKGWLSDDGRLEAAGVPIEERNALSRAEIALALIDAARADGLAAQAVAGWADNDNFLTGLEARGLERLSNESAVGTSASSRAGERLQQMRHSLGLDHFEGRSWRGFHHHACLVMLAEGFRHRIASR